MQIITITVFLIRKSSYPDFLRLLKELGNGFVLSGGLNGYFYPIEDHQKTPAWANTISQSLVPSHAVSNLKSQSPAGIMSCRIGKKLLAVTFGHAWMKLKGDWIEHDFGRRVALNILEEDDLKQIRSEQVLAKRHRSIERSPNNAKLYSFNYESDRDLVFSIEGIGRRKLLNGNIRGGAAFRFDAEISSLASSLYETTKLLGYGYQNKFPDIDNLISVTSKDEIIDLESELDMEIANGNKSNKITMAPPSSLETFDQDIYFSHGRWAKKHHTKSWSLNYSEWVSSLKGIIPTLEMASKSFINVVDASTSMLKTKISAKESFSFDISRSNGHFLIFSGKWYKASPNLEKKISSFLKELQPPSYPPPAWNQKDDEKNYNLNACAVAPHLLHMDARIVHYGGNQSKFEFCDFADHTQKILYFVKNPSSSAGMSHLYEQARRTSELFFGINKGYIEALTLTMAKNHPAAVIDWIKNPPRSSEWEICLVSMGKPAHLLPMFAKCGLMRLHRELSKRFKTVTYAMV
ncbi:MULTISPECIES: TIGR04141 family sporadically distributed protein [unclassified Xanthomonas]|uniref:TIGR04141 family sporadically distributed protein n=1 Tax=Xanthomonas sp. LMG 8992 TaxID=1591157 RepID=UPI00136F359B|nr:TIGR04141 family sporadically distributed protein [Xanthomonas sp. LMG 8992]